MLCILVCKINGSKCNIGSNCRFSYEVIIRATDGHTIVEKDTRHILNEQKHPLIIGDHCWIGLRTIINKNVQLPHDTIVGSGSVLTKKIDDPYCIIAGSPARVIKNNVKHHKETIYEFKRCHNNNPN
jgi:acetyltransferase-like isoleucine patch superfamily enzyme